MQCNFKICKSECISASLSTEYSVSFAAKLILAQSLQCDAKSHITQCESIKLLFLCLHVIHATPAEYSLCKKWCRANCLAVSLSCPARSKVRNRWRWRWRWRSVCKILSHVESLSVLTIELFMLSVQWSNVPCCPLIRYSQCLPFHWALIESFAGFLRLAGAIDISALCSLLAITFTQKLMAERTWQNLNHLVWRMQASKYPVLLLLTPDCFVLDCGWLFDCHRLWKFDKHFLFVSLLSGLGQSLAHISSTVCPALL